MVLSITVAHKCITKQEAHLIWALPSGEDRSKKVKELMAQAEMWPCCRQIIVILSFLL